LRIPRPETKGGPGDEDAFEDGFRNRDARLEEGTGLTTVPLETRVTALRVRAVGSFSGVPGYTGGTDLSGALDDGEVGGT